MAEEDRSGAGPDRGRDETDEERADRNLNELLGELRVALPGVQVLFAFLLTVPFSQRFAEVNAFQRSVYFATLLCSAAASALLIAPTAQHRINFGQGDKAHIVTVANRCALAGLGALALAMVGTLVLVTDVLFPSHTMFVGAGAVVAFAILWLALPLARRLTRKR